MVNSASFDNRTMEIKSAYHSQRALENGAIDLAMYLFQEEYATTPENPCDSNITLFCDMQNGSVMGLSEMRADGHISCLIVLGDDTYFRTPGIGHYKVTHNTKKSGNTGVVYTVTSGTIRCVQHHNQVDIRLSAQLEQNHTFKFQFKGRSTEVPEQFVEIDD